MKEVKLYIIEDNKVDYTWKQVGLIVASIFIGFAAMSWFVINLENLIW